MFKNKYSFLICSFVLFFACKEDSMLTFSEVNITTDNNILVEINIPRAFGDSTISSNINSEISKLIISRLNIGDSETSSSKSIEESVTAFNNEYRSFVSDFPESTQPWEAQIDGEVMYQSEKVISISLTFYINTGGAHGILQIPFLNFNTLTGKPIENKDLFNNLEAFKSIAKTHFDNAVEDKNTLFEPDNFTLPANIGYTEEGLILLYNVYEIAPYSTGTIEFTIPYKEVDSVLVLDSSI
ncbi:DUF3298 and DUF4163 domain-containing protein [Gaetbulibacter sp. M235]|uniref:DUF3298 and DUF4163 domain-containing protein n=1 Tax=Gaetbulibacter sp. M235 TaxID=3126510 RepID=UPI00374F1BFC